MKFHVTYQKSKRLMEVQDPDMTTFHDALVSAFPSVDVDAAILQWYFTEIDDWVDIEPPIFNEWSRSCDRDITKIRVC